jgi:hypothetical protein
LAALLSAYFDDSQDEKGAELWVVAGYVGYGHQWDHFERLWKSALDRHGVPYFHMTEMNDPKGPFAKWLPPQDHKDDVVAFFKDLVAVIQKCMLFMVSSAVWIKDLERFNHDTGLAIEAYPLAAYTCMMNMAIEYTQLPITAVFDRANQIQSKLDKARVYARSDERVASFFESIATIPLQKSLTVRDVPALQAADFIAWELRKEHHKMRGWKQLSDRPIADRWTQWGDYLEWTRQLTGGDPVLRRSLNALIEKNSRIRGLVWDYQQLLNANEARGGIWSCEGAQ